MMNGTLASVSTLLMTVGHLKQADRSRETAA